MALIGLSGSLQMTIVVSSCITNCAAATYFMALSMPGNFQCFFPFLHGIAFSSYRYVCEKHRINL